MVVGEAENGAIAVEKYRELKPDIVTMDITMPEMDGLAALKAIRAQDSNAKVIMVSAMYAKRLDSSCRLNVVQARDNQTVDAGTVYIAPGDFHMKIEKAPHGYVIRIMGGERVSGHRPSVNVLFRSVAAAAGKEALGIILTGMGEDGASGLLELRRTGADTIGQNAESSVVYGMPKVAYEIGAVCRQSALQDIPRHMIEYAYRH